MMVLLQAFQQALKMWTMSLMVYKKSDLILVAARPAMGKTAFTLEHRPKRNDAIRQDGSLLLPRNGQGAARWSYSVPSVQV